MSNERILDLRGEWTSTRIKFKTIEGDLKTNSLLRVITDDPYLLVKLKREEKNLKYKINNIITDRPVKTVDKWEILIQGRVAI